MRYASFGIIFVIVVAAAAVGIVLFRSQDVPDWRLGRSKDERVVKSDDEWRAILTPEQFHVTREKGTERAFTGKYWNTKDDGVFVCICCG